MIRRTVSLLLGFGLVAAVSATPTYLALGDSIAFGYLDGQSIQSYGIQGYVDDLALTLDAYTGVHHDVLNLAVGEETSVSFGDTSVFGGRWLNLNYSPVVSQLDKMTSSIASIKAAGNTVDTVSFCLGANDFLQATAGGSKAPTQAQLLTMFGNIQARYTSVLTYLRTELPTANILLPGYYNLFAPNTPEATLLEPILTQFNLGVKAFATQFNAKYVDFYGAIKGNETTYIQPGIHPNPAGYDALGRAMSAQVVPEPSTMFVLGIGVVAGLRRRRRV